MRYRLMATYRGVPYEAGIGPSESDVVLFAACPPPEELGFEPATGHWRKQLRIDEVQALWESRPTGKFRGQRCIVLDDLGDRLHIAYLGHDAYQAEQLGYWQVDRGVFELITPRDDVTDIVEERTDYPGQAGAAPRQDGAATKLADLAAVTLAHLATMSHSPARGSTRTAGPPRPNAGGPVVAPGTDHGSPSADDPALEPAAAQDQDPQRPAGPPASAAPPPREEPLPLEAAARRAASAATAAMRRQRRDHATDRRDRAPQPAAPVPAQAAAPRPAPTAPGRQGAAPGPRDAPEPLDAAPEPQDAAAPGPRQAAPDPAKPPRRRRTARKRDATQRIFSELAGLAAIPPAVYSVGAEVDGAMCLIQSGQGFEVFNAVSGARHEVRSFQDEESAYFYLFGVLAADAVRTGRLAPRAD